MLDDLHDNPKWVTSALEEILDIVKSYATDDDLRRAIRQAEGCLRFSRDEEKDNKYSDEKAEKTTFASLQTKLFEAWLELLAFQYKHCYDEV